MNHVAPIRRSYHRDTAECGHGTCGAAVDCTGECALKAAVINLPVIDPQYLDSQIESTRDLPIQYADEEGTEPDYFWIKFFGAVLGIAMWLVLAFHVFNK
ncbi:MAG: hypothetical protein NDI59_02735 [Lysobacter sp.]|nr:hypothetical protein [Lysobacter sp.]